jgi:hypothetical protein
VLATREGQAFTAAQWMEMSELPTVTARPNIPLVDYRVEKGSEPGVFLIYPRFSYNDLNEVNAAYREQVLDITYSEMIDNELMIASLATKLKARIERTIDFNITQNPQYRITPQGFEDGTQPIVLKATLDGREFTDWQWAVMPPLPTINIDPAARLGDFRVEKTGDVGVYHLYPELYEGDADETAFTDQSFSVSHQYEEGIETWSGVLDAGEGVMKIEDGYTWFERNKDMIRFWSILGALLLLVLGYIPPFKKYLPKSLKARPKITCMEELGMPPRNPPPGK